MMSNSLIKQEDMMQLLDNLYHKCMEGVPNISENIEDFANDCLCCLHGRL